jgi:hypothetical protein
MEHDEQAEQMEEDAERMEEHSDQLGERIDDIQSDWEQKEQDASVPGARPDQSDQLPEEGHPEATPDDAAGEHGTDSPGVPGEEETGTGNPDAAGAED